MSERETGAQSEQVTCHWQGQDGIMRAQTWWCGDREKPTRVGQNGFCIVCGTGLGPCGTEQARCDVRPDPHDGLTPYDIARNASASIRLAIAAQSSELAITYAENAEGHVQRLMELAALSQSALAPAVRAVIAEDLKREEIGFEYNGNAQDNYGDGRSDGRRELALEIAAALAATGAAQGDGDTALMDALEEAARYGSHYYQSIVNWLDYERDSPPAWLKIETLRDLARALLAQAGGASDE